MDELVWLQSYPADVPHRIDGELDRWMSVGALLEAHARRFGGRTAFSFLGRRMSFGRTLELARRFAFFLRAAGVAPGDRVAIMMPNCLQYPVAMLGTLLAGAVVVNVNPLYTAPELRHQLDDSGAVAMVLAETAAPVAAAALPGTAVRQVVVTGLGDLVGGVRGWLVNRAVRRASGLHGVRRRLPGAVGMRRALRTGAKADRAEAGGAKAGGAALPAVAAEDLAFLQYTGGTTGVAKGAMLTHRNIVANTLQAVAVIRHVLGEEAPVSLAMLPMYHVFALTMNALAFFTLGGESVLIADPRRVDLVLGAVRGRFFNTMCGTNTLFANLLDSEGWRGLDFSRLRLAVSGGMRLSRAVAERWHAVTGVAITQGYGLTEASPVLTVDRVAPGDGAGAFSGSVGLPVPSTEIRMRRADGGWAALGETGEICARGPQVMRGYWGRADDTARAIDAEGWLATGDVGVMDERGFVSVVERVKDVIIVSGFNVYPTEVEDVANAHPGVRDCAAVGVADEVAGERVRLIVVRRDASVTRGDIIAHCRRSLTGYKIPSIVEFTDTPLPRSNVGKLLRRALPGPTPLPAEAPGGTATAGRPARSLAG